MFGNCLLGLFVFSSMLSMIILHSGFMGNRIQIPTKVLGKNFHLILQWCFATSSNPRFFLVASLPTVLEIFQKPD